ncbi:hypothetical protein [Rugamonas apoptosis]|uniref:STAS domain-containing protein n=1 Tax=Rugamonas apoptosis TaxID=2758570 RepID=A0A7W2F5W1_9BURK|nr:hypothetical protein [Rugamonas apoptosis]MBA5685688.1 hypothetical protein [Rugamonas apoptosis]
MGIFSLFKKQDAQRAPAATADADDGARLAPNSELQRQQAQALQRDLARATAMKIDAIEAAMALDIFQDTEPAWGSRPARPPRPVVAGDNPTLPLLDEDTTELLGEDELPAQAVAAQTAPVVEEIAIVYANGQADMAEQMLVDNLPPAGAPDRTLWWMLFDLYQLTHQQDKFDSLSIDYASTFETSPPPWNAPPPVAAASGRAWSGVTPTELFSGQLDGAIGAQLERLRQQMASHPVLRLDFSRVQGVTPDGCALLLPVLQQLHGGERELIVVAADHLAALIQATVAVGNRDGGPAPWLLLLELLQLLNREKDFEETGMDYCVTFEVSPPSFVAPRAVATAARQALAGAPDRYLLPTVVEGPLDALLGALGTYAEQYQTLVFDCSRLARVEFGAANTFQSKLQTLVQEGKKVEFRDVNHLVAALLRLLGYGELAKIYPHKY